MTHRTNLTERASGTYFRAGKVDPYETQGVITGYHDAGVDNVESLSPSTDQIFPDTFPGDSTNTPLRHVDILWHTGKTATTRGFYRHQRPVSTSVSLGLTSQISFEREEIEWWAAEDDPASNLTANYEYDPEVGDNVIVPRKRVSTLMRVSWLSTTTANPVGGAVIGMVSTVNANTYTVLNSSYTFQPQYALYTGPISKHYKAGGIDQWLTWHSILYHPYTWVETYLDTEDDEIKVKTRSRFTLSSFVNLP